MSMFEAVLVCWPQFCTNANDKRTLKAQGHTVTQCMFDQKHPDHKHLKSLHNTLFFSYPQLMASPDYMDGDNNVISLYLSSLLTP